MQATGNRLPKSRNHAIVHWLHHLWEGSKAGSEPVKNFQRPPLGLLVIAAGEEKASGNMKGCGRLQYAAGRQGVRKGGGGPLGI
jgi:hypothetical protein